MKDPKLFRQIMDFEIDEPDSKLTFVKRLARENGWKEDFAIRVVTEYRKFVYLTMISGQSLTPSDEVDQAWHLHMLYTDSYFRRFCGEVLGRELSHAPTKGGKNEGAKFSDQYKSTKGFYAIELGSVPPKDIWPSSSDRFGDAAYYVRINRKKDVAIPRTLILVVTMSFLVFGLIGTLVILASSRDRTGAIFVIALISVVVLLALSLVSLCYLGSKEGGGNGWSKANRSNGDGCGDGYSGGDSGCSGCGGCGGGGCGGCG